MSGRGLKVKAVLLKDGVEGGVTESRRFRMEEKEEGGEKGGEQRMQSLLSHASSVFNVDPTARQCHLYWRDSDGDLVKFSTDQELSTAVAAMPDDVLRLYVMLSEEHMEVTSQPEGLEKAQQENEGHVMRDVMPPHALFTGFPGVPAPGIPGCPFPPFMGRKQGKAARRHQRRHGCHGKKGGKHRAVSLSSDSEQSDGEEKAKKKVPREFRKYARRTVTRLHKKKGDNCDNKEEATRAGLSLQVQEFVDQVLVEWHAKLTSRPPRAVTMEMAAEERSLPEGVEQNHFRWLCRFLARWHRRHAGHCDVMSGWSSGETSSDDSSVEECSPLGPGPGFGPCFHGRAGFRGVKRMMRGHPHGLTGFAARGSPHGMMGFAARGSPHGMMGFSARGSPHGMMGFAARGSPHGMMGFAARGSPHGMMGFAARGSPHGMMGFAARGSPHGMIGCPSRHACGGGPPSCPPPPPPPPTFAFSGAI